MEVGFYSYWLLESAFRLEIFYGFDVYGYGIKLKYCFELLKLYKER